MTVVGKILVFLVLVCSLAVGGFAVMDFTARTHWADQYDKLAKKYQVVQASSATYKAEAERLAKEKQDYTATLSTIGAKELGIKGPKTPTRPPAAPPSSSRTRPISSANSSSRRTT